MREKESDGWAFGISKSKEGWFPPEFWEAAGAESFICVSHKRLTTCSGATIWTSPAPSQLCRLPSASWKRI